MRNIFEDRNGNRVIAQRPNGPILLWLFLLPLRWFSLPGTVMTLVEFTSFGALFTWSWLELFRGVNTFRRILGILGFLACLYSILNE